VLSSARGELPAAAQAVPALQGSFDWRSNFASRSCYSAQDDKLFHDPSHIGSVARGAVHYGYWAVAGALLLETPASRCRGNGFAAGKFSGVCGARPATGMDCCGGTLAATVGDNLGYAIGNYGGVLCWSVIETCFESATWNWREARSFLNGMARSRFYSRDFVFGMRVIAGPLAGVLRMPWKRFVVFNFLERHCGECDFACRILFGGNWRTLMHFIKRFDLALAVAFILVACIMWWKNRKVRGSP